MDYLPLFFHLQNQCCLLIGGGESALCKARLLAQAGAYIRVVAPRIDAELEELIETSQGEIHREVYREEFLQQCVLVISAIENLAINKQIFTHCRQRHLPINVVDNPKLCTVIMPAIVDRNPLLIGISSGGQAPVLTRILRSRLESLLPAAYGQLATFAKGLRERVKTSITNPELRRRFWEKTLQGPAAEQVFLGQIEKAEQTMEKELQNAKTQQTLGEVYLVGVGPGDPDLLTFKALRLMQQAEVILYDRLISPPILDKVRRDAERIYVGKKRETQALSQQKINRMLLELARQGKRVLRLKSGDPFIFGRGGEEIELLAEHNIPFQVVPGITAASGCACYAGIPLTHRDYAQSVRFITGHIRQGELNLPWSEMLDPRQTLVFYMGLLGLGTISAELLSQGRSPQTPVALIEKGTTPEQTVHITNLQTLPHLTAQYEIHAPTLLIIGDVVQLHEKLNWDAFIAKNRVDTE